MPELDRMRWSLIPSVCVATTAIGAFENPTIQLVTQPLGSEKWLLLGSGSTVDRMHFLVPALRY
jgi:hypothetical protein